MTLAGWAKRAVKAAERGDAEEVMRHLQAVKGRGVIGRDMEYVLGAMAVHEGITIGDFTAALGLLGVTEWDILSQQMHHFSWFIYNNDEGECIAVARGLAKAKRFCERPPASGLLKAVIVMGKLDLFSELVGFVETKFMDPGFFDVPVMGAIETGDVALARRVVSRVSAAVQNEHLVGEMLARVAAVFVRKGDRGSIQMLYSEFGRPGLFERIKFGDYFCMLQRRYDESVDTASEWYMATLVSKMMEVAAGAASSFGSMQE